MMITNYQQQVNEAVAFLEDQLPACPDVVVQLGTGLGDFADLLESNITIPYSEIPHSPASTVMSHKGNLVYGLIGSTRVAVLQGRFHYYEGYSTKEVTFLIRVLARLGTRTAIITNASGGLRKEFSPGTIMIMKDHIYLLPENPLRGPNVDEWGERFPDLSKSYDVDLQNKAMSVAKKLNVKNIATGTYVCVPGPSLETPAETRYLKMIGADAVGMSSVPEIIVAVHSNMKVLGLSVVSNVNDPDDFKPILLDDVVASAEAAGPRLQSLLIALFKEKKL